MLIIVCLLKRLSIIYNFLVILLTIIAWYFNELFRLRVWWSQAFCERFRIDLWLIIILCVCMNRCASTILVCNVINLLACFWVRIWTYWHLSMSLIWFCLFLCLLVNLLLLILSIIWLHVVLVYAFILVFIPPHGQVIVCNLTHWNVLAFTCKSVGLIEIYSLMMSDQRWSLHYLVIVLIFIEGCAILAFLLLFNYHWCSIL